MLTKLLVALLLLCPLDSFSQKVNLQQFYYSDYTPDELNVPSGDRIEVMYQDYLSRYGDQENFDEKKFVYEYNFFLDRLNRSGHIFYGDEISAYLNQLKDFIIDDPELRRRVNVYIADYHYFNAFTNDFGNIYVNIASIAKMNSEDELLYLLAHEIAHVIKRHSHERELFIASNEEDYWDISSEDALFNQHAFSRAQELEADEMAIEMLKDKVDANAMLSLLRRLEVSDNPVFTGAVDLNLLFENNTELLSTLQESWTIAGMDTLFYPVANEQDDSLSTHPSIGSRIEQLTLKMSEYTPPTRSKIGDYEYFKELASFVLIQTYIESENLVEALDLVLKLRVKDREDDFLKEKQMDLLALIAQQKYSEEPVAQMLNVHGNSCNDKEFLQLKLFFLKMNKLDMSLVAKQLSNHLLGADEVQSVRTFLYRLIYEKNPNFFNETDSVMPISLKSWDPLLKSTLEEEYPYPKVPLKVLSGYAKKGFKIIVPSDSSLHMKSFFDQGIDQAFIEAVTSWNAQKAMEVIESGSEILLHPAKASYVYSPGVYGKSRDFDINAQTALVHFDNLYITSHDKRNFQIDPERTLELEHIMKGLDTVYNSYDQDYSNKSRTETTVLGNYLHRLALNWIVDHGHTNELVFSTWDAELKDILRVKETRYLVYSLCIVNSNKGFGKKKYMNYYAYYFDLENDKVSVVSKIGTRNRHTLITLMKFLGWSKNHRSR